jgi:hypothetical protein
LAVGRRIGPDGLHGQLKSDARHFDVEGRRQRGRARNLEPQTAVAHIHDRGRFAGGGHPESAQHALARPPPLPANVSEAGRHGFQELGRHHGLADENRIVPARLELDERLVVAADDDHLGVGVFGANLHHEVEAVETAQADVGDEQVERLQAEQPLGAVERGRTSDVVTGLAEQLHEALERVLVVIEYENSIR